MATQTSNLGLTKPAYDEAADIVPAVNNNMDTLDSKIGPVPANTSVQAQIASNNQAIAKLDESIAIVSDGNTHGAIASGQYVYVKNHGTLTEGLYTANSAISANATLSSSNVTAVSGGGLNALNSKITSLTEQLNGVSSAIFATIGQNTVHIFSTDVTYLNSATGTILLPSDVPKPTHVSRGMCLGLASDYLTPTGFGSATIDANSDTINITFNTTVSRYTIDMTYRID